MALRGLVVEKLPEILFLKLRKGLIQYLLVHLVPYFGDEPALFGSQYVPRPPDIEVAHGNAEAAS